MTDRILDESALLDLYDRVVAHAAAHLTPEQLEPIATIGREARRRRTITDRVFVVGLLGGTGSGKSSLLNALAGSEVSPAGAVRPTTSSPLAWHPQSTGPEVEAALEALGIDRRVPHELDRKIALVDLPDTDSLVKSHRGAVAAMHPILDLAVWVVDPEKYRDRVLHDELLRPLAGHQAIFRFVLNQIDRLGASDLSLLMADLERALRADGIAYPTVWPAAADPPIGPPIGIDEVWEGIVEALGSGSQRSDYLVVELRRGASMLAPHVVETGFGWRWERTREQVADLIGAGQMLASEVALRGLVAEVAPDAGDLGIGEVLQSATAVDDRAHHLDVTLGRRIRDLLRPKAHTRALLNELQLALASAVQGS